MWGVCCTPTTPTSWAKGLIVCLIQNYTRSMAVLKCACT